MIEDRIRKLLAMAEHANSNPHEAANAAARAAALAVEHNIDLQKLRQDGQAPKKQMGTRIGKSKFKVADLNPMGCLLNGVGKLYGCAPAVFGKDRPPMGYYFVGQHHNTELAVKWTEYLWESCKRANTKHTRGQNYGSSKLRELARRNFRLFFCLEVAKRLREKFEEMTRQPQSGDSKALVVMHYMLAEIEEAEAELNKGGKLHHVTGPQARMFATAATAGRDAGRKVSLNDQLEGGK